MDARKAQLSKSRRHFEWLYVAATISAFVVAPELRRLLEFLRGGFSSVDVISSLPLFMLLPVAFLAIKRRSQVAATMYAWVSAIWLLSFAYGALIGTIQREMLPAMYGFALFCLPLAIGAWLLTLDEPLDQSFSRISGLLAILGAFAGVYGLLQYVFAPPWDTAWMQQINAVSFGNPVPFGIRVFGPLNSPQTFAVFITSALIFTIGQFSLRRWWMLPATVAMVVSLGLSMVRTAWIEMVVAIIVLVIASPYRVRAVAVMSVIAGLVVVAFIGFFAVLPNTETGDLLTQRFTTFLSLDEDYSAADRRNSATLAIAAGLAHPLGVGLGLSTEASKLADPKLTAFNFLPDPAIDEGYISRFYETGFIGIIGFITALLIATFATLDCYFKMSRDSRTYTNIAATCLALQTGTLFTLLGDDCLQGAIGCLYFISIAFPVIAMRERTAVLKRPVLEIPATTFDRTWSPRRAPSP